VQSPDRPQFSCFTWIATWIASWIVTWIEALVAGELGVAFHAERYEEVLPDQKRRNAPVVGAEELIATWIETWISAS